MKRRHARGERPWRAVAYLPDGMGGRHDRRRTAARTRPGLDRFIASWTGAGYTVDVWEVLPHPQITAAAEASAATVETYGVA